MVPLAPNRHFPDPESLSPPSQLGAQLFEKMSVGNCFHVSAKELHDLADLLEGGSLTKIETQESLVFHTDTFSPQMVLLLGSRLEEDSNVCECRSDVLCALPEPRMR
jgi:hypothetical protein